MKMFRKDEGFTLVELMVVVLIIGILVAIAVPIFAAAKANAQAKTCAANIRTVEGAYQSYLASDPTATAPADWAALMGDLVPGFIAATPTCPNAGNYTISFTGSALSVACDYH